MKLLNVVKFEENPKVKNRVALSHSRHTEAHTSGRRTRKKGLEWLGPCASALCLVHCFGMAALSVLAPGFLEILPHSEWVEGIIFAVALMSGTLTLIRTQIRGVVKLIFVFFGAVGLAGLSLHLHSLLHISLIGMAFLQLFILLKLHGPGSKSKPACCIPETPKP